MLRYSSYYITSAVIGDRQNTKQLSDQIIGKQINPVKATRGKNMSQTVQHKNNQPDEKLCLSCMLFFYFSFK